MKMTHSFLLLAKLIITTMIISYPLVIYAKEISLLDQPKNDAKVVATIDLSAGVIPIYTPKDSGWVKIADPKNGNVGWVKSTDLSNTGSSQSTFTYTQSIVNDNKSPTAYQIIQFGQPTNLTPEQTQTVVKRIQKQQEEIQQSMQNMMRNMDRFFYDDWHYIYDNRFPFLMPVIFVPLRNDKNINQPDSSTKKHTLPATVSKSPQSNTGNTTAIKK